MHQKRSAAELCPDPLWDLTTLRQTPLLDLTSRDRDKGNGRKETGGERTGEERVAGEGEEGRGKGRQVRKEDRERRGREGGISPSR